MSKEPEKGGPEKGERIAKRLSRAGICSRREAERWIEEGRVRVDGKKILTPATLVTANSNIVVDGKPVAEPDRTRLWRYHKPDGLVCSTNDKDGRTTIYERLPATLPRVMTVGRLDLRSEGLLLLTNDGELARKLELPATGWTRRYRARIFGNPDDASLAALANGITADGVKYGPIHARVDSTRGDNSWLSVSLQEGKNREIRRVMEFLGFRVNRLIRVGYGPFQLGKLERGEVEEVTAKVVAEQTGGEVTPRLKPQPPRSKPPAIYTHQKTDQAEKAPSKRPAEKRPGGKKPGRGISLRERAEGGESPAGKSPRAPSPRTPSGADRADRRRRP